MHMGALRTICPSHNFFLPSCRGPIHFLLSHKSILFGEHPLRFPRSSTSTLSPVFFALNGRFRFTCWRNAYSHGSQEIPGSRQPRKYDTGSYVSLSAIPSLLSFFLEREISQSCPLLHWGGATYQCPQALFLQRCSSLGRGVVRDVTDAHAECAILSLVHRRGLGSHWEAHVPLEQ